MVLRDEILSDNEIKMSKYSSDSDSDDYKSKKSKRRRYRSSSTSSRDSYKKRRNRRSHKSRSRSRSRDKHKSSKNSYDKGSRNRNHFRRSRSPYQSRRYKSKSQSRSRSRSRSVRTHSRNKYSNSKKKHRSRSGSQSHRRRSRSHSRKRSRSKQRYSSDEDMKKCDRNSNKTDGAKPIKLEKHIINLASDDPVFKQEILNEIDQPSFTPKSFQSKRAEDGICSNKVATNENDSSGSVNNSHLNTGNSTEDRKNETLFHDNIVFQDPEAKIQKWVKHLLSIRHKFLHNSL